MAELTGFMELNNDQCVMLGEDGVLLIQKVKGEHGVKIPKIVMELDAAAATMLFDFLLIHQEKLCRWRDGFTP